MTYFFYLHKPCFALEFSIPIQFVPTIRFTCQQHEEVKTLCMWRFHPHFSPLRGSDFVSGKPSFFMKLALIQFTKHNTEVILSKTKIIVLRQLWTLLFWISLTCQIERLFWHFALKKQQQSIFVLLYLLCRRVGYWKRFHNSAIRINAFYALFYSNVRKRRFLGD